MGKHLEEDFGLLHLTLQINSSSCLVLILHRQLGHYLLSTGDSYGPTAQHNCKTLYASMFATFQQNVTCSLGTRPEYRMESWCQSVIVIYVEKISTWCRNSGPVTYLQEGHQLNTSCQDSRSQSIMGHTWRHAHKLNTQEEIVLAQTVMCCLLLPRNRAIHLTTS